MEVHVLKT